jgi:serine/threonine-protein kinase HipA
MTSDARQAFVWIWLTGCSEPVVCGRVDDDGTRISFTYGRSYLSRSEAVAIYEPELPLRSGPQYAVEGVRLPLCLDDTMPDSWGRTIIHHRRGQPTAELPEITYLLESSSDRLGALDYQTSADEYVPRQSDHPSIDDLAEAARRVETGDPLNEQLRAALLDGTALGGARPKALVRDGSRSLIAKFSSSKDQYPIVQGEYVAMELARRCSVDAAHVELTSAAERHALLVERFDREPGGARRRVVSTLTVLGYAPFPSGVHATYAEIADAVRARFAHADRTLRELFARISFNILCGNTDDHGRNHAAFVGGAHELTLAPAYDVCPQARLGEEAAQAMAYGRNGERQSQVKALLAVAPIYHLDADDAQDIVDRQIATITDDWNDVCDRAGLTREQRGSFWRRQFLNPYALR